MSKNQERNQLKTLKSGKSPRQFWICRMTYTTLLDVRDSDVDYIQSRYKNFLWYYVSLQTFSNFPYFAITHKLLYQLLLVRNKTTHNDYDQEKTMSVLTAQSASGSAIPGNKSLVIPMNRGISCDKNLGSFTSLIDLRSYRKQIYILVFLLNTQNKLFSK